MRFVPIEAVKEGSYLAKTIYDDDGRVLLREGVKLSDIFIKRIKLKKIKSVYINDEYTDIEIEDIIKPELRQKAVKSVRDTFHNLRGYNFKGRISNASINKMIKERDKHFEEIAILAGEIIEELLSQKNILINVVDIKSMDNYTYQHSVNVAILSLIIGIQLELTKPDLYSLCMGALLHDVGKIMIPKEVLFKIDKLTDEEFDLIKEHPKRGYDYLKSSYEISSQARAIVLQHHERVDGSGYPDKRDGDSINQFSKIVSVADVYDALTSDRNYRRAICPNDALEFIMAGGGTQFDYGIIEKFVKCVVPYPEGTLVKLNNGDIAVVEKNLYDFPLRPEIKIVKSENHSTINTRIELVEKLDFVIKEVVYNI